MLAGPDGERDVAQEVAAVADDVDADGAQQRLVRQGLGRGHGGLRAGAGDHSTATLTARAAVSAGPFGIRTAPDRPGAGRVGSGRPGSYSPRPSCGGPSRMPRPA
ncbi:hypothetical protein KNE206_03360 [Kitasatospora sp. NE20-6]